MVGNLLFNNLKSMTRKQIRQRRYLRSLGRKKVIIREKTIHRHHFDGDVLYTLNCWPWLERFKSLFVSNKKLRKNL